MKHFKNESELMKWLLLNVTPIPMRTQLDHIWYHNNKEKMDNLRNLLVEEEIWES